MNDYDIWDAFQKIENEIITSMMRNLSRHRAEEEKTGYNWQMWQSLQLKALERFKHDNRKKYSGKFRDINSQIKTLLREMRREGEFNQEMYILQQIKNGFPAKKSRKGVTAEFFKLNDRKLNSLIKATTNDMEAAETAILRRANDQYRKIIYAAQMYANTGAGTYEKAVDMATKDFLSRGIDCVEYRDGSRHTLKDYSRMAIRTASKRAYLQGEGEKRKEWNIPTVIVNKRGNPCPKCLPHCGKVYVDDVWSGGPKDGISPVTGIKYPLLSTAVKGGLYHPNCKDSHTTYFEGVSTPPSGSKYTSEELDQLAGQYREEQKRRNAERQAEKYERLEKYSLDPENKKAYAKKHKLWETLAKKAKTDIIKPESTKEVPDVHLIGKINREIYKCVTADIVTDEVIITDERIGHIKDRHPNDYERYCEYLKIIVENPDYIIETNKPKTALILKEIVDSSERQFKTVLRLTTSTDNPDFKNSIITFMKIDEKEWSRLLRNKQILYKRE